MMFIENTVNNLFSSDILNLTSTEIIALCETSRFITTKGG